MTQAYLYKWTHIDSKKWYIGSRTKKDCHINDGYICSSKIVKPMIIQNPEEWTREIILTGEPEDIRNLENEFLQLLDAKNDPRSFNQHNGDGKFTTLGASYLKGIKKPDGFGEKISKANKGKPIHPNAREALAHYAFVKGVQSSFLGKTHSVETREQMSQSRRGKSAPNFTGHIHSEDSKKKISQSLQGRNNKLTEDQVRDIKYNLKYSEAVKKYADIISESTIQRIRSNKSWGHI